MDTALDIWYLLKFQNHWTIVISPFIYLWSQNTFLPISPEHSSRCINMKLGQWHPVPRRPFQPDWNWMAGEAWMGKRTHCRRLIKYSIGGDVGRLACFGLPIVISLLVWLGTLSHFSGFTSGVKTWPIVRFDWRTLRNMLNHVKWHEQMVSIFSTV